MELGDVVSVGIELNGLDRAFVPPGNIPIYDIANFYQAWMDGHPRRIDGFDFIAPRGELILSDKDDKN